MSLRDALAKPPVDPSRQYCTVGKVLDNLLAQTNETLDDPMSEYAALVGAMANVRWSSTSLVRTLQEEGFQGVTVRHMREHRARQHNENNCRYPNAGQIPKVVMTSGEDPR